MANDTKERILEAALEMFSQKGYAGTNIRELSASLGLVKSGVYKHYESKEAIWNALLDEMIAYYGEHFGSSEHLPPVPDSLEGLVTMTMQMVNFTVHDEKVIMTRKVLTLEQFRDSRARELATKHFLGCTITWRFGKLLLVEGMGIKSAEFVMLCLYSIGLITYYLFQPAGRWILFAILVSNIKADLWPIKGGDHHEPGKERIPAADTQRGPEGDG